MLYDADKINGRVDFCWCSSVYMEFDKKQQ